MASRRCIHSRAWVGICIALALMTLLIWGNSMRTAAQSAQQSTSLLSWLTPWLNAVGIPHHPAQAGPLFGVRPAGRSVDI